MRQYVVTLTLAAAIAMSTAVAVGLAQGASQTSNGTRANEGQGHSVQLGPRPFFLINDMEDGKLKDELLACAGGPLKATDFSIGHRGAALQFPEHTEESYRAGARMGAGIVECDVTFTLDKQLVCRHAQDDLATTTNILATSLASKCITPFTPASGGQPAKAVCRTSELTLAEFKTLRGKMDAFNPAATTVTEFMNGTPDFRTNLYVGPTSGHLLSLKEAIALFQELGVKMTPELKSPAVSMPFNGFTYDQLRQKMIDEHKAAGVSPSDVFAQSFIIDDIKYWIAQEPAFGKQAVFLDDANVPSELPGFPELVGYKQAGINIVGPPIFALLALDSGNTIVPSLYAKNAKAAGLDIITWTLERSGILADGNNGFYFQTVDSAIRREGDVMNVLDVLAQDVGIRGIFSDWAATVSYYANCKGLK